MKSTLIDYSKIPHKPGVYLYKDIQGKVLYVGKAINLHNRVSSYFSGSHDLKTQALVEKIARVEIIEVLSEIEALILEANLIKKHLPPYNIKLTDDKDYLYIKVTKEQFPKILTARKKELTDAKEYFGPFPSSKVVRETLKKLRRIFPWCSGKIVNQNQRPCFYYHLGLCPGSCVNKINQNDYSKIINGFIKFMKGKKEELIKDFTKEMRQYAGKEEYKEAQQIKKILSGLEYLSQPNGAAVYLENPNFVEEYNKKSLERLRYDLHLVSFPERIECFDISNLQGKQAVGSLVVLTGGDIDKRWYRRFKISLEGKPNDVAQMREVVKRRLKHPEWLKPDLILVDGGRGQVNAVFNELIEVGWQVPVFGLAKRMEWLYLPDGSVIKLPKSSLSLRLLQKIRDEAHRFALSYHRHLRSSWKLEYN